MTLMQNTKMFLGSVEGDTPRDTSVVASNLAGLQVVMDPAAADGAVVLPVSREIVSKFCDAKQAALDCIINFFEKHIP